MQHGLHTPPTAHGTKPLVGDGRAFARSGQLVALVQQVRAAGGRARAVGGAVRDHLLGRPCHDVDVEVYGLSLVALEAALAPFAVHAVGRSFGVLKVDIGVGADQQTFDVSLPRRESKRGLGHKGFVVESDAFLDLKDAAARRDFTINAIAIDLDDDTIVDPHDGVGDLRRGLLRHVSDAFDEDALRVLRAAQFAARFCFNVDAGTLARCRNLRAELKLLPAERLWGEFVKLLTAGVWPSIGLEVLRKTDVIEELFSPLHALIGCPQEQQWHPEGDVWSHTLMVIDEAAAIARDDGLHPNDTLCLTLAALCHDLGKPSTTQFEDGRLRSRAHDSAGELPTRALLTQLGAPHALIDDVVALVLDHLKPFQLYTERDHISDGALRRLALRVPIARLVRLARADHFGRTTTDALTKHDPAGPWLLAQARRLDVDSKVPRPILLGRHLIAQGLKPGAHFKALLSAAFAAQLDGEFATEHDAIAWLTRHLSATRDGA